jgi:creatinine amidohydrolase/Fe(II)-dependent formamide hydrolase-like protein
MQIADYLRRDDRIVLPVGSTEQHGYLSLGTDALLTERVSVEAVVWDAGVAEVRELLEKGWPAK